MGFLRLLFGAIVLGGVAVAVVSLPDVKRYLRMKNM
ncbi:hypothetical protein BH23ACT8_BH23ACT8_10730 [soil metagenome]|jgi:hypothetical protein